MNQEGETPLAMAELGNHVEVAKILRDALHAGMEKSDGKNENYRTHMYIHNYMHIHHVHNYNTVHHVHACKKKILTFYLFIYIYLFVSFFTGKHIMYSNIYTATAYSYQEKPQLR